MPFDGILKKYFDTTFGEVDFVNRTYNALRKLGFNDENTIAATCICRDEIAQSLRSIIKHLWGGEAFNLSSLGALFFAGKTGIAAAMHHSPVVGGKERYVFYALPHIAINAEGRLGVCMRTGRAGESAACGALHSFQKEMAGGRVNLQMDNEDVEQSLVRMRLLREMPYGTVPDLLELTRYAQAAIQADIENTLTKVVDPAKSDYAVITGMQIHGPDANFVQPGSCYAVVDGRRRELEL
jgi:hypothetical protein